MANNKTELSVNTEVIEKMAEIAAKEVDGVAGLSKKTIDLKGIVKSKNAFKGVKVENINGAVEISVFICVKQNARVKLQTFDSPFGQSCFQHLLLCLRQ